MEKFKSHFIGSLILFIVLYAFFTIYNEIHLYGLNTGTIAFITIAQKYIRGDFSNAVVGGFNPLSSWLLIPFLKVGIAPVAALSIVKLIVGLLILIGTRLLSFKFEMTDDIRNIVSLTAVPIVLQFTLTEHIPDLLVVCSIAYYLSIIFSPDYHQKAYKGVLCGVIGAVGYLGKSFMFPFFIAHFILLNVLHYFRTKEKIILRNAIFGLTLFFIISAPWIIAVSSKYHEVTFDVSGAYNNRIRGPEVPKITEYYGWEGWRNYIRGGHPVYDQGFFPPPNDTAISIWEDFTLLTPYLKPWSPFESWDSFKYQLGIVVKNIYYTIGILENYYSIFSIAIIAGYILLYLLPVRDIPQNYRHYPLVTLLLYCGGYMLFFPNVRYLWVNNILILLMGGHVLNFLFQDELFNKSRRNLLIAFFALSFVLFPVKEVLTSKNYDKEFNLLGEKMQVLNEQLSNKKIASNDKFSEIVKVLFYSNMKLNYYGQARKNISDEELQGELKKYDIDYYLVWGDPAASEVPRFISICREITGGILFKEPLNGKMSGLRIYSLKERS